MRLSPDSPKRIRTSQLVGETKACMPPKTRIRIRIRIRIRRVKTKVKIRAQIEDEALVAEVAEVSQIEATTRAKTPTNRAAVTVVAGTILTLMIATIKTLRKRLKNGGININPSLIIFGKRTLRRSS